MRRVWEMLNPFVIVLGLMFLAGCSQGLKEVGFAIPDQKDGVHHIVNRDFPMARWSVSQPHPAGTFHCTHKRTSEEMAELRRDGNTHTWYAGCTPTSQHPQHQYAMTMDQSVASLAQGPVSSALSTAGVAFLGHQLGRGIGRSGDTVTQNGGGAQSSSSAAGGAGGKGGAGGMGGKGGSANTSANNIDAGGNAKVIIK